MKLTKDLTDSLTLKFSELARKMVKEGKKIYSLGLGEPGFDTPPLIKEAAFKAIEDGYTKYSNSLGLYELRELITKKFRYDNGIITKPENIVVTPGAKNAFLLSLMAILRPNDTIVNFNPCYVSYFPQFKIAEPTVQVKNIDLKKSNFLIDWEKIYETTENIPIKALILNFPNNPTGKMLDKHDFDQIVKFGKQKGCYIISDEIYEKLNYSNKEHFSPGSVDEIKDQVITINGFSKTYSMTGWRIGYLTANSEIVRVISKLQQHINTNTATFTQKAACAAFDINLTFLREYNKELEHKSQIMAKKLNQCDNLSIVKPEGGFFGFLNISKTGLNSDEFSTNLLRQTGVATTPGIAFGTNWDDHVRISLSADSDTFFTGIDLICKFSEEI